MSDPVEILRQHLVARIEFNNFIIDSQSNNIIIKSESEAVLSAMKEYARVVGIDGFNTGYDTCLNHQTNKGDDISEEKWLEKNNLL